MVFQLLAIVLLATGCSVNKYIPEGKKLISTNRITVETPDPAFDKKRLASQLESLISQKPNSKVLGLFRTYLYIYYRNTLPGKKQNRYRRFMLNNLAEPPSYVDTLTIEEQLQTMQIYLRNQGFFQATGSFEVLPKKRGELASIHYHLIAGNPLRIKDYKIKSSDPALDSLLPFLNGRTSVRKGNLLNNDTYTREVKRITETLRNEGYAFFFPNQISSFQVDVRDTSQHTVSTYITLLKSEDPLSNQAVNVGSITLNTNQIPDQPAQFDTTYLQVRMRESSSDQKEQPNWYQRLIKKVGGDRNPLPSVRPEVLYRALNLKPGDLYRESGFNKMNRRLSMLGVYRFVNLRTTKDTLLPLVNMDVQLTRHDAKAFTQSGEFNNTTAIGDNSNVVGVSISTALSHRNLLRRAINASLSLEPSVETNLNPININALNATGIMRFQFPFFEDYFRVWEKSKLKRWYPRLFDDAKSQFILSYSYNNLLNFWETQFMNINYGFEFSPNPTLKVRFDHFQVDYYKNILKDGFIQNAPKGLELAFQSQFLTGFLFRSVNGSYNAPPNRFGETWSFRGGFEQSGIEVLAVNEVGRLFNGNEDYWDLGGVKFAKYIRADGQWTYARNFGKGQKVATRFSTGLILPFADTRIAPYIKQFSVGGPSSMRGWLNGQLGPGGFVQTQTSPPYFQRGDLRIEANVEWRQKIFWIMEGAAFLDGGNVWNLKENAEQPSGDLRDIHKEWALAGGLGIRLNFQFFILAYDVGAKIRYPYKVNGSYWAKSLDLNFFNILLGYPF